MRFDASSAVQIGAFGRLNGDSAVIALADVWQHPPELEEGTALDRMVVIGPVVLSPEGGKDGGLDRATFEIHSFSTKPDLTILYALQAAVRDAIEDRTIVAPGAIIARPWFLSSEADLLDDGVTYQGTQKFETIVQPA